MSDHNYMLAARSRCANAAMITRPATATAGPSALLEGSTRTSDHPPGCGCDPCPAEAERLRRRGGAVAWPHLDEASMSEHDRDRPERGGGLDVGLALLLGIELGEGELP